MELSHEIHDTDSDPNRRSALRLAPGAAGRIDRAAREECLDMPRSPKSGVYEVEELVCACASVRRASRAVTQLYDNWLRRQGIEGPQFALLAMLDRMGPTNQTTMGQRFDLDKTTLSRNLQLLNQRRWITIGPGSDGRERRVALTLLGRQRLVAARPAWRKAQEQLRAGMRDEEWNAMWKVFVALTRAARAARRRNYGKASTE
jgi:DNA-binding MarR family transcriptional regulator